MCYILLLRQVFLQALMWVINLPFESYILKIADDTLFIRQNSWGNIRALKAIMILFELKSGLKVNFHKRLLDGINVAETWLVEEFVVLNSKLVNFLLFIWSFCLEGICFTLLFCNCLLKVPANGYQSGKINWNKVCSTKEVGVWGLREFNQALLEKWCWRLLVDQEGLCYKVLPTNYGASWFKEKVGQVVGDGDITSFRCDPWMDGNCV
uniref:RNA-directed DNA polymerase, related n=1 Tax=Medicago truncatula TaxID=3880 RepID=Q2HS07_MEDTR|nr:RNA-directed DNA polymerase, related [Medicago truncatula]